MGKFLGFPSTEPFDACLGFPNNGCHDWRTRVIYGIDPRFAHAPGRWVVRNTQRMAIDAVQANARAAASQAARLAERRILQSSQAAGFASDEFERFIKSSVAEDAQEWAVAIVSRKRLREINLDSEALIVRLSSESAATPSHRRRWSDYNVADWERVQQIVDDGDWVVSGPNHRIMWIDGAGKPWMLVLKRTAHDELYMASYRRATRREVTKWQEGS